MKQSLPLLALILFCQAPGSTFALNHNPEKSPSKQAKTAGIKMISTSIFTEAGIIADGNRVVFDAQYSNAVDGNDAIKINNPGENFGLLRNSRILAVEARQPVASGDTLFYNMTNLVPQVYKLEIAPQYMDGISINCELVDRFLNTRKNISLTDSNHFTLVITADPASKAANRLIVIFNHTPVPVHFAFTNMTAININNSAVSINWQVNQELNVAGYEVERSPDAVHYNIIFSATPRYNDQHGGVYQYTDKDPMSADNFYRIRVKNKNGSSTVGSILKVSMPVITRSVNIFPNPAINKTFQVRLNQLAPGKYYLKLTNNSGQLVYSTSFTIQGNNFTRTITLSGAVSNGDHNVTISNEEGFINTQRLIIQ